MSKVKFEDVATRVNTREDKDNTSLLYYVGGDHIESGELVVHNRGLIEGSTIGPMFYFGFKKGDILLVSRNPHLRKASMVDFDGICSEKTFVIGTKDEKVLLQKYLAVIVQSDSFWNYCEEHKSGGVNFFVNWSTLAKYEFDLPDIEEQRRISDKVWAAYGVKESYRRLIKATGEMVKSQFIEMFGKSSLTIEMQECFSMIRNGANIKQGQVEGGFPITRIETISDETIDRKKMGYAGIIDNKYESYYLQEGDILVSHINSLKHIGKCALYCKQEDEIIIHGMNLLCLRPIREIVVPTFAIHMLRSDIIKKQIADITKPAVNQASFSVRDFGGIKAIIPNIDEQNKFVAIAEQADKSKFELKQAIEKIDKVMRALLQ